VQRGLEGRRIALYPAPDERKSPIGQAVVEALEAAGADVDPLVPNDPKEDWHGARYAALVLLEATAGGDIDPRLVQLTREFLVADKPLVAAGNGVRVVLNAGGVQGRHVAADHALVDAIQAAGATCAAESIHVDDVLITATSRAVPGELAGTVVRTLSHVLEDRALDEMSDSSFPASDPPSTTPGSVGHLAPDRDERPRP
jgi:DJ-1/PfpI family